MKNKIILACGLMAIAFVCVSNVSDQRRTASAGKTHAPVSAGAASDLGEISSSRAAGEGSGLFGPLIRAGLRPAGDGAVEEAETRELAAVFAIAAAAANAITPDGDATAKRRAIANEINGEVEAFVASHTNSAWTPGARLWLARAARMRCGYSRAIEHYRQVWEALKVSSSFESWQMALQASQSLASLLALTGRLDDLDALEREVGQSSKSMPGGTEWKLAMEMRAWARRHPTEAYKCGLYCLDQLGRMTQPGQFLPKDILETDSSVNGFTAAELVEIGRKAGLHVHAGLLSSPAEFPIPCIVHLQSEHFVVVRERRGAFYNVLDPVSTGPRWLTAEDLAQEATGCVLVSDVVPASPPPTKLSLTTAQSYRGRCHGSIPSDHDDSPDPDCNNQVSSCCGAPTWFVSQPFLNLWLTDIPLAYRPAYGPPVNLRLSYNERRVFGPLDFYSWVGARLGGVQLNSYWSCSWLSFAELDPSTNAVDVMLPAGGWATFTFPTNSNLSDINYRHNLRLEQVTSGGNITSLLLHYPDGSQATYGTRDTNFDQGWAVFYLSDTSDVPGNKTTFTYDTNFLLTVVTASDGVAFTLHYGQFPEFDERNYVITNVTSSYGASVAFEHNASDVNSQVTGITDAAGIYSRLVYAVGGSSAGNVSDLITPYGTTSFAENDDNNNNYVFDRIIRVTLPNGTQEFYAQMNEYPATNSDWPNFAVSQIPTNTLIGTLDTSGRQERNTFYWNAQQFAPYVNTPLAGFHWPAFKRARIQHWLAATDPNYSHFDTLSAEQEPSPDGNLEGQLTFYDYVGKPYGVNYERGNQILPSVIARVMPDSSTAYTYIERTTNGFPTKFVEKWVDAGSAFFRTNSYVYAINNIDLIAQINALGVQVLSNIFNSNHQVATNYDGLNQMTSYTYDPTTLQLTSVSRPSGLTTTNNYDGSHRLQQVTDLEIKRTNSYTWYANGNVQTTTDERGLVTTSYWDGLNRLTGTSDSRGTSTNLYYLLSGTPYPNSSGGINILDLTATRDRMGYWTYFDYDALRRKIGETNANGAITRYGYCDCGAESYITNAFGSLFQEVMTMNYDYQGNRISTFYADGYNVTNWFDPLRRVTTTGDGWGYRYFYFNNLGLLTNVSNAFGAERSLVYDVGDRLVYVTDANAVTITNIYDDLGRLRTRGYPDGGVEKFGYSARGLVAYTNQIGRTNFFAYDEASRKTFETNANSELIRYTNNAAGDLLSLTDGKNQTTKWKYNEYGLVTNKVDQAGSEILRYQYNADSRLTNRWSVAKGNTKYAYDPVGNLTNIDYTASTDISFAYDSLNRLTNMVDASGTTKYTYTAGNQLYTEDGPFTSDTVTNTYLNRLRTVLGLQQPTGYWTNQFSWDPAKRLTNVTSSAGSFAYTLNATAPASPLIRQLALPNGSKITNSYDSVARLTSTYLRNSSGTALDSYVYVYDPANERTNLTRADASTVAYKYDAIGQLKVADSSVNSEDRGYKYDAAWNLNNRTNAGVLSTFSVDSKNQLTTSPDGQEGYDSNGNRSGTTSPTSYSLSYDDENQLASLSSGVSWRSDFVYDGLGRLRKRTDYSWTGSSWTASGGAQYIYDGNRVIQERNTSGTPTVAYTRGTDLSGSLKGAGGIGGLLSRSSGYSSGNWSTHYYYYADGNGNVTYLVDSSQALAAKYRYDPFGNLISTSGAQASANTYRFSSKEIHANSGFYYYLYRWYEPNIQRWLNRDSIGERGGLNLYGFAGNDSVNEVDPFGLEKLKLVFDSAEPGWDPNDPKGTFFIKNSSEILDIATRQVGPRDANGKCPNCISELVIAGHGGSGGEVPVGGEDYYSSFTYKDLMLHKMNLSADDYNKYVQKGFRSSTQQAHEIFSQLAALKCKNITIKIVACNAGQDEGGSLLRQQLMDVFGPDANIITFTGSCGFNGSGKPVPGGWDPSSITKKPKRPHGFHMYY